MHWPGSHGNDLIQDGDSADVQKLWLMLWKTVWLLLRKLQIEPYNPAVPPPSIYPKGLKLGSQRDSFTPVFTAAVFTTAKTWKRPKCPSTEEWIKNMWYIHTVEYNSSLRKEEKFVTWVNLEVVMPSDISESEKGKYCIVLLTWGI